MSRPSPEHPLDIDLLDYVDGAVDAGARDDIEAHLAQCLVCRIKRQRLSGVPPMDFIDPRQMAISSVPSVQFEDATGVDAHPGELWLTGSDDATMVLVKGIRGGGGGVVVVPVTLDVEVADEGTIVVDERMSPIGLPIAIYDDLPVSLPSAALVERVVPIRALVDLLTLDDGSPGVERGTALEGSADPRLEVRQYLMDRLEALDPFLDDQDDDAPSGFDRGSRLQTLRTELLLRRGPSCVVDELTDLPVSTLSDSGWVGIAFVRDFTVRVIVIETPSRLVSSSDYSMAQALFARLDGSAVAVCTPANDLADLYDAPTLFRAWQLPDGGRTLDPAISGLSLADCVAKFLDQKRHFVSSVSYMSHAAPRVDAAEILSVEVTRAVEATVSRASRLRDEKKSGFLRLRNWSGDLDRVLTKALEPDFDPQSLTGLVGDDVG